MHVETEIGGQIDSGILTNVGPRLRTTGTMGYELGDVPEAGRKCDGDDGSDTHEVVLEDERDDRELAGELTELKLRLTSTSRWRG